jgi:hypothetical protein
MKLGRAQGGGWTFPVLAALALAVFVLVNHASSGSRTGRVTDALPAIGTPIVHPRPVVTAARPLVSILLARRTVSRAGPHCGPGRCCPTRVRSFGTRADIVRVIARFQRRGFRYAAPPLVAPVSGDPKTTGTYLRWLGERPGDARAWRLVNVSTGAIDGVPGWETVFRVSRMRCGAG